MVVSEESGTVSLAYHGELVRGVNAVSLADALRAGVEAGEKARAAAAAEPPPETSLETPEAAAAAAPSAAETGSPGCRRSAGGRSAPTET